MQDMAAPLVIGDGGFAANRIKDGELIAGDAIGIATDGSQG
jgi:hypothetical protein